MRRICQQNPSTTQALAAMPDERLHGMRVLVEDLRVFGAHCLRVSSKTGKNIPLVFNEAQERLHEAIERQRAETGKVRVLVLKARQLGISTYAAARFYHQTTTNFGRRTLIVAHQQKSTSGLFDMVKMYHRHNPLPVSTAKSNAIELVFDKLESKYSLATAGTEDVGRGMTAQLAHLSEYAFWSNGAKHMAGLGNTVSDEPGTEIIIESTANGIGNHFHKMWQDAEAGIGEYIAVFLPWFIDGSYRATVPAGFERTDEEVKLVATYGLDDEQLQWRRNKIATYGNGMEWLFMQEHPCCAAEAFQTPSVNSLISPGDVQLAVNSVYRDLSAPLLIGVDPAGDGVITPDRTAIAFRRGRVCVRIEYHVGLNTMQIAGKMAEYNREMRPAMFFVDKTGLGAGVVDRAQELGLPVIGIANAGKASDVETYENIRAEMWWRMAEWFADQPVRIPNNPALVSDITAPQPKISSNGRKLLEKKEDLAKRGVRSPDGADALALTFAMPIGNPEPLPGDRAGSSEAPTTAGY